MSRRGTARGAAGAAGTARTATTARTETTERTAATARIAAVARRGGPALAACALTLSLTAACGGGGDSANPRSQAESSPPSGAPAPGSAAPGAARTPQPPREYPVRTDAAVPGSATLERARQRGVLIVGIRPGGTPYVARKTEGQDRYTGFEIEVIMMVAADLGFSADQVLVMPTTLLDPGRARVWNPAIDLYIGIAPEGPTTLLEASAPYYAGGQALLVRADDASLADGQPPGAGRRVCASRGPEAEEARDLYPDARILDGDTAGGCVLSMRAGHADAVFGYDPDLRGWAAKFAADVRLVPVSPGTRRYAFAAPPGEAALRAAIDASLSAHRANGDLRAAYDATLGLGGLPEPAIG